jgi:uncharacterized membrane protein YcgQ (UPF0703/DUF1980 family)
MENHAEQYGFIAQDILKAGYSEFVGMISKPELKKTVDSDGCVSPAGTEFNLNYGNITSILTRACQYLLNKITLYSNELDQLKKENQELKTYLCKKDREAPFCH